MSNWNPSMPSPGRYPRQRWSPGEQVPMINTPPSNARLNGESLLNLDVAQVRNTKQALAQELLAERGLSTDIDPVRLREQLLAQRLQQVRPQAPQDPTQFLAASLIGPAVTAADGGEAEIAGEVGKTYNLLSDQGVEMNVLYDTLLGDGVGPTQTAINIQASDGSVWSIVFKIEAGPDGPTAQAFLVHGEEDPITLQPNGLTFTLPGGGEVSMQRNEDGSPLLVVQTGEYAIQQQIGPGPSIALQIETGEAGAVSDGQPPSGFLGQTFVASSEEAQDLSAFETEDPNLVAVNFDVPPPIGSLDEPLPVGNEIAYSVDDLKILIDSVDFDGDGGASLAELQEVAALPLESISAQAQFLADHFKQISQDGNILSKTDIENAAASDDPTVLTDSDLARLIPDFPSGFDPSTGSTSGSSTTASTAASVSSVSVEDIQGVFSLADTDGNGIDQNELQQLQGNISSLKDLFSSLGQGLDVLVDSLLGNISNTAEFMIKNFDAMAQAGGDATTIDQTDVDALKGNDGDDSNVSLDDLPTSGASARLAAPSSVSSLAEVLQTTPFYGADPQKVLQEYFTPDEQGNLTVSKEDLQKSLDELNAEIVDHQNSIAAGGPLLNSFVWEIKESTAKLLQALLAQFDEIAAKHGKTNTISWEDLVEELPTSIDSTTI